jgi:histone deacetylase 6
VALLGAHALDKGDTFCNEHTHQAALLAAGGVLAAAEAVAKGRANRGVALVRPPGHHAEAEEAMGFCLYNNVAVAAAVARKEWGVRRVLIVDWDVHHGNGEVFFCASL